MSTELQKNLAQEIIKNTKRKKPKNKRELLVSSGYALKSAESVPAKLIEQKGVKEALESFGFTEDNAKKVVSEILLNKKVKPETRLKASDQVFKVHGSYKNDEGEGNTFNFLTIFNNEQASKIARRITGTIPNDNSSSEEQSN